MPQVWNIRTNAQWSVQTLVGHSGTVRCLHLEGNRLVSGSSDKSIKVRALVVAAVGIKVRALVTAAVGIKVRGLVMAAVGIKVRVLVMAAVGIKVRVLVMAAVGIKVRMLVSK